MDLEPLSPTARQLLDAERASGTPPAPEQLSRVLERLEQTCSLPPARSLGPGPAGAIAGTSKLPFGLAMLSAGLIAGSVGTLLLQRLSAEPAAQAAAPEVVLPPVAPPRPELTLESRPSAKQAPPALSPPKPSRSPAGVAGSRAPGAEPLGGEQRLLDIARAALVNRRFEAALDALEKHRLSYPEARLAEEREALTVQALAQLGRSDEARTAAARFRARFPRSIFLPAVDAVAAP